MELTGAALRFDGAEAGMVIRWDNATILAISVTVLDIIKLQISAAVGNP